MYLFAEASESNGFGFLILIIILVLGTRQMGIWLKGNDALRGGLKRGLFYGIGKIFKK